eukprot:gene11023-biopygen1988
MPLILVCTPRRYAVLHDAPDPCLYSTTLRGAPQCSAAFWTLGILRALYEFRRNLNCTRAPVGLVHCNPISAVATIGRLRCRLTWWAGVNKVGITMTQTPAVISIAVLRSRGALDHRLQPPQDP